MAPPIEKELWARLRAACTDFSHRNASRRLWASQRNERLVRREARELALSEADARLIVQRWSANGWWRYYGRLFRGFFTADAPQELV